MKDAGVVTEIWCMYDIYSETNQIKCQSQVLRSGFHDIILFF